MVVRLRSGLEVHRR